MNRLALGLAIGAATLLAFAPSCLERRDDEAKTNDETRCSSCHGDALRSGDYLARAAPPRDLAGSSDPSYPGVGAHSIHLNGSDTHAAFACNECHVVPDDARTLGHADSDLPAELTFGALASTGDRTPTYDPGTRQCSNGYCHREAHAVWTSPKSSKDACGTCHGLPPAAPHPQSARCSACHAEVVDDAQQIKNPALHVDGKIQFAAGDCAKCHGSAANAAPPADTSGNQQPSAIGVGAHQAHLAGGNSSRPLACGECHTVPASVESPGHADGLPAEVMLTGVANAFGHQPSWDRSLTTCGDTHCHGPGSAVSAVSPSWIEATPLGCTSCHGTPPPAPHPQITDCSRCHGDVVGPDDVTIADRSRHVDGNVDVSFDSSCTACHGSTNPAPPFDLSGSSATSSPGVGAHQAHVLGSVRARAVPCSECHVMPDEVLAPGHLDSSLPAELAFSGAAQAFGGTPSYAAGACTNTSCHGGTFPSGHASGGTNLAPIWTQVDGTQAACGSCHGLPPPGPHPLGSLNPVCNACHQNVLPDNLTFVDPTLHVNGVVDFLVP